jgi:hypothetical protein
MILAFRSVFGHCLYEAGRRLPVRGHSAFARHRYSRRTLAVTCRRRQPDAAYAIQTLVSAESPREIFSPLRRGTDTA